MSSGGRFRGRRRGLAVVALITSAVVFVLLRLPLLTDGGISRGWHSDAAIYGLMGRDILRGEISIFFWGQNYMGPFTSVVTALWGVALGWLAGADSRWLLSLRLATMTNTFAALLLFAATFGRVAGLTGAAAPLLLLVGPPFFFLVTVVANGADMTLFFTALIVWLGIPILDRRFPLDHPRTFWLGLAAGVGWWMNQGVVFVLAALALTGWWTLASNARGSITGRKRAVFRTGVLIGSAWLVWNLAATIFPRWIAPVGLVSPLAEPILLMIGLAGLAHLDVVWRSSPIESRRPAFRGGVRLAGGFFLGWAPVWAGGLTGLYTKTYSYSMGMLDVADLQDSLHRLLTIVLPRYLGIEAVPLFAVPLIALAIIGAIVLLDDSRHGSLGLVALLTILAAFAHFFLTQEVTGTVRYLAPSLPFVLLFIFVGTTELWRRQPAAGGVASALVALMAVSWILGAVTLTTLLRSRPDPREVISEIARQGYAVCYAGFWEAYHLRFVGNDRVAFIPYRSRDRSPGQSRLFERIPGPRCLVTSHYEILPFGEAHSTQTTDRDGRDDATIATAP